MSGSGPTTGSACREINMRCWYGGIHPAGQLSGFPVAKHVSESNMPAEMSAAAAWMNDIASHVARPLEPLDPLSELRAMSLQF
jgi:hypothetical protein